MKIFDCGGRRKALLQKLAKVKSLKGKAVKEFRVIQEGHVPGESYEYINVYILAYTLADANSKFFDEYGVEPSNINEISDGRPVLDANA